MNVFVLDKCTKKAAQAHVDRHVIKMILESAQILSTACRLNGVDDPELYKMTHKHHPCTIMAASNRNNYLWVLSLMEELCKEYTYRFNKVHSSQRLLNLLKINSINIPNSLFLEFAQAMPCKYKRVNPVAAYRAYYSECKMLDKNNKPMGFWKNREVPSWITKTENQKTLIDL
jgi:hypothetical protein